MEKTLKHEEINKERQTASSKAVWTLFGIMLFTISVVICFSVLFVNTLKAI